MKKLLVCGLLATGSLFAMNNLNNYVEKTTGLGPDAKREIIYDPMMAEMMRSMNDAEDNAYVRDAAAQGRIITKEQARAEINAAKQRITQQYEEYVKEQQRKAQEEKTKQRAADSKKAFSGMKKGFL